MKTKKEELFLGALVLVDKNKAEGIIRIQECADYIVDYCHKPYIETIAKKTTFMEMTYIGDVICKKNDNSVYDFLTGEEYIEIPRDKNGKLIADNIINNNYYVINIRNHSLLAGLDFRYVSNKHNLIEIRNKLTSRGFYPVEAKQLKKIDVKKLTR